MASRSFSVLGDPIEHSLSPVIHSAAYKTLGLDWNYSKVQVAKGSLAEFLSTAPCDGFSVTMPLKDEAASIADSRDKLVSLSGVANTLVRSADGFAAFNTDVFGISKALESVLKKDIEVVAILGAGATAKSALMAIAQAKPFALFDIYVRDESRASDLLDLAGELELFTSVHPLGEFSNFQELTVNTLPKDASESLPVSKQNGYLLNVNYAGADKNLVDSFKSERVVTGKTMLVWQALQQIRLFSGLDADQPLDGEQEVIRAMFEALA
jgi:shikimate dehydrogenase